MKKHWSLFALLVLLLLAGLRVEATPVDLEVVGNQVFADIDVSGAFQLTLILTFEDAVGLNENTILITATQISPTDPVLNSRLGGIASIPSLLPIVVNVMPALSSTLSFTGTVDFEITTKNLTFAPALRLYKAPGSGAFDDITNFSGVGSYRVRGTGGDFSDLLIVTDLRTKTAACNHKFSRLQSTLSDNASFIDPELYQELTDSVNSALALYQADSHTAAASELESMILRIKADEGSGIPNVYRANDSLTRNVAGKLREQAATLIFSLRQ